MKGFFDMNVKQIFPPASDRAAWAEIQKKPYTQQFKDFLMAKAETILSSPVPDTTATLFMEYVRNGNRTRFQDPYYARRSNMSILAVAECFEYHGRFIDKIIDYMWAIVAEPTWVLPAHCQLTDDPFPEFPVEIVDLFSSETALELSLVMNLVEKEIAAISPNFIKFVRDNIIRRIAVPLEDGPAPFWFEGLNNWTPWCCCNSLGAIVWALRDDVTRQEKLINTLHNSVKNYIRLYPEDGLCFEGPLYWAMSPGQMLFFFEQLGEWPDDPKIRLMAEYIADTRMTAECSMNFGDCASKCLYYPWMIYRFGEKLHNETLKAMGMETLEKTDYETVVAKTYNLLAYLFWLPGKYEKKEITGKEFSFYDKTQFFIMRKNSAAVAAKRGHAWSHHHMDIGHFMLFFKEKPVIIDFGAPEYTKDTFNENRFKNHILNNEGHNVLHFNNAAQFDEAPPAPGAMQCIENEDFVRCTMDLTTAYKPEAKLKSYIRELVYDCNERTLTVCDKWSIDNDTNDVYVNFYTPRAVTQKGGNLLIGDVPVTLKDCEVELSEFVIKDPVQIKNWGNSVTEIKIRKKSAADDSWKLVFDLSSCTEKEG